MWYPHGILGPQKAPKFSTDDYPMAQSNLPYFLFGLGVGAACGLIWAPKTGEELRGDLRHHAGESRDYMRRRGYDLRDQADVILDRGRSAMHSQRDQLAAALEAGRRAYRDASGMPDDSEGAETSA